ncbi:unnamed protein product [Vitrella brassicaformis CCMP3155]|uniref:Uncharacterized protein n=3 Tax=Vitrella brassicaformis TaxID=1169539 RepID=A0A0G4EU74_VITBC|nr:unnamed protein product [Vitrella brassicaformis CCMP3155]|eukprot:CEM01827.1 unnamed protein product [Vitrella brassicaformis CCMP3155]
MSDLSAYSPPTDADDPLEFQTVMRNIVEGAASTMRSFFTSGTTQTSEEAPPPTEPSYQNTNNTYFQQRQEIMQQVTANCTGGSGTHKPRSNHYGDLVVGYRGGGGDGAREGLYGGGARVKGKGGLDVSIAERRGRRLVVTANKEDDGLCKSTFRYAAMPHARICVDSVEQLPSVNFSRIVCGDFNVRCYGLRLNDVRVPIRSTTKALKIQVVTSHASSHATDGDPNTPGTTTATATATAAHTTGSAQLKPDIQLLPNIWNDLQVALGLKEEEDTPPEKIGVDHPYADMITRAGSKGWGAMAKTVKDLPTYQIKIPLAQFEHMTNESTMTLALRPVDAYEEAMAKDYPEELRYELMERLEEAQDESKPKITFRIQIHDRGVIDIENPHTGQKRNMYVCDPEDPLDTALGELVNAKPECMDKTNIARQANGCYIMFQQRFTISMVESVPGTGVGVGVGGGVGEGGSRFLIVTDQGGHRRRLENLMYGTPDRPDNAELMYARPVDLTAQMPPEPIVSGAASVSGPVVHSPAYVSGYAAYGNPYYPSPAAAAAAIDPSTAAAAVAAGMPQYLTITQQPHQAMAAPYLTHTGMGINTDQQPPQYSISYPNQQQHQQQQQQQAYTSFPQGGVSDLSMASLPYGYPGYPGAPTLHQPTYHSATLVAAPTAAAVAAASAAAEAAEAAAEALPVKVDHDDEDGEGDGEREGGMDDRQDTTQQQQQAYQQQQPTQMGAYSSLSPAIGPFGPIPIAHVPIYGQPQPFYQHHQDTTTATATATAATLASHTQAAAGAGAGAAPSSTQFDWASAAQEVVAGGMGVGGVGGVVGGLYSYGTVPSTVGGGYSYPVYSMTTAAAAEAAPAAGGASYSHEAQTQGQYTQASAESIAAAVASSSSYAGAGVGGGYAGGVGVPTPLSAGGPGAAMAMTGMTDMQMQQMQAVATSSQQQGQGQGEAKTAAGGGKTTSIN